VLEGTCVDARIRTTPGRVVWSWDDYSYSTMARSC
jgi:hypothetical protein